MLAYDNPLSIVINSLDNVQTGTRRKIKHINMYHYIYFKLYFHV